MSKDAIHFYKGLESELPSGATRANYPESIFVTTDTGKMFLGEKHLNTQLESLKVETTADIPEITAQNVIVGNYNELYTNTDTSLIVGESNLIHEGASGSVAIGNENTIHSPRVVAIGSNNSTPERYPLHHDSILIGQNLVATKWESLILGEFNVTEYTGEYPRISFGIGTRETRKNGLDIYRNGTVRLGADPVDDMDAVTKRCIGPIQGVSVNNNQGKDIGYQSVSIGPSDASGKNTITREYNVVIGKANTVEGPLNLASGENNNVASGKQHCLLVGKSNISNASQSMAIGKGNTINTGGTFAVGLYNQTSNKKTGQLVVGKGNAVDDNALFIVGNSSSITNINDISDPDSIIRSNAFVVRDNETEVNGTLIADSLKIGNTTLSANDIAELKTLLDSLKITN